MKEQIERAKKIWDSKIFQTLATVATIGILSWGWSAYHSVNALPDAIDTLTIKDTADSTLFTQKNTADSLLITKEVGEAKESIEETEVRLRSVEDALIEYKVKQDLIIQKLTKISDKLDED